MGNCEQCKHHFQDKSNELTKKDIENLINETNNLTRSRPFIEKTGLYINFKVLSTKPEHIEVEIYKVSSLDGSIKRRIFMMKPQRMVEFYTKIIECTPVFYSHSVSKKMIQMENTIHEDLCCVICLENIPTCHISCRHKFCEYCISNWVLYKENTTCPICRENIEKEFSIYKKVQIMSDLSLRIQSKASLDLYTEETLKSDFPDDSSSINKRERSGSYEEFNSYETSHQITINDKERKTRSYSFNSLYHYKNNDFLKNLEFQVIDSIKFLLKFSLCA